MSETAIIVISVTAFTLIVVALALLVLAARRVLVPDGQCTITINEQKNISADIGRKLLPVLDSAGIHLPGACGGAGTCGLCKLTVLDNAGEAGAQELAHISRNEARHGVRLACQIPVLHDLSVQVSDECFGIKQWTCTVDSVTTLGSLVREIVLKLPTDQHMDFKAGGFVQISCPAYSLHYKDLQIEEPYRATWDHHDLWRIRAGTRQPVTRAYSMANHPDEDDQVLLNIRLALPPPNKPDAPSGVVSSWLFSLQVGDRVDVTGPYGHFFVQDTDKEAVFIGGGVGLAPLRAQILDLLERQHSKRKLSLWYGARSQQELYYDDLFNGLAQRYDNFDWHVALSEPDEDWDGLNGFIHQAVLQHYLESHPSPESCEYYLCGPPLMIGAVRSMLDELGVEPDSIFFDDFGS